MVGQEGGGEGFHNKLGRLEKTFSCYTWLDDILFWKQNFAKCFFLSFETTRCVGPQLVLNPKGSVKISIVQKALLYKGIDGNVCAKGVINIIFSTLTSFQT